MLYTYWTLLILGKNVSIALFLDFTGNWLAREKSFSEFQALAVVHVTMTIHLYLHLQLQLHLYKHTYRAIQSFFVMERTGTAYDTFSKLWKIKIVTFINVIQFLNFI